MAKRESFKLEKKADVVRTHRLTLKEKRQFINELPKIYQAQQFILENLIGKSRFFFYETGKQVKWLDVRFGKNNFMHLCGIKYQGGAKRFWEKAISNKLSMDFIEVKNDGSTFQKLKVITAIRELNKSKLELTSSGVFLKLHYDHLLRTRKDIMGIALTETDYHYTPLSLLNLQNQQGKFNNLGTKLFDVIAIVDMDLMTGEFTQLLPENAEDDYIHYIAREQGTFQKHKFGVGRTAVDRNFTYCGGRLNL
ncbi:PBECR4 domain-containing protein [Levilactobacillus koreensis]|uniref:Phage-Barnase-EndoU-ColicinE5/D-RelE like nuclease 4 domain-containing protein n=1 Tax=Levilactobacillus koreensis TaxID=637971 RepID=A0AAC9EQX9_9LACO|nr:PBECR4 domain-containing protein [Levilactobacillus koreensis]AKP64124.1 hypothetical protein ABN16_03320 [Levilactobacillus koreensis]